MSESMNKSRQASEVQEHHMPQGTQVRIRSKDNALRQDAGSELPAVRTKPVKAVKGSVQEGVPAEQRYNEPAHVSMADPQAGISHANTTAAPAAAQDARVRIRTKEAVARQEADTELPLIRSKQSRTIKGREQDSSPVNQSRSTLPTEGKAVPEAGKAGIGTMAAATMAQATSAISQAAAAEQNSPRSEPAQISPQTRRAIKQATATVVRQGAYVARLTAAGVVRGVAGKAVPSQRVNRRNDPRVRSTSAPKLMKRTIAQAGRGVKYAVSKAADQFSDSSKSNRNPDSAVSDLAIRQAQALAGKALQFATRKAAQAAGRAAARVAAKVGQLLAQVVAKGVSALLAAAGPVGVVIIVVIFAAIMAVVLLSPMGIFAGGGGNGTPTIATLAQSLTGELNTKISRIQQENTPFDELQVVYEGSEDNTFIDNWPDVLAVFAVKVNMDPDQPMDVVEMDGTRQQILRDIFWDMNSVTYSVIDSSPSSDSLVLPSASDQPVLQAILGPDDEPVLTATPIPTPTPTPTPTKRTLTISVNSRSYSEMEDEYQFTDEQRSMLEELMAPDMQLLFYNLIGQSPGSSLTPEQINEIRANLPADLDVSREKIVLAAYSLVGKVDYFWGGKSFAQGWDSRWGKPTKVTSAGNPSTGTTRPFGLDCSGFVAWTFLNAGIPKETIQKAFGTGSSVQWKNSVGITWVEIMPGDIVFYNIPGTTKGNHVAVCVGFNDEGKPLIAESPRTGMRVKVSVASKSFRYVRRPIILMN